MLKSTTLVRRQINVIEELFKYNLCELKQNAFHTSSWCERYEKSHEVVEHLQSSMNMKHLTWIYIDGPE